MLYIDFDGVILDTESLLFYEWNKKPNKQLLSNIEKIKYIQNSDWNYIINNSNVINDAIYNLHNMDYTNSSILTKVHSLSEGVEKVNWLKNNGVRQSIILVRYNVRKVDMVDVCGNILVDDCLKNLNEWYQCGGEPILFDIDDDGYDSWKQENIYGYQRVLSLSKFK